MLRVGETGVWSCRRALFGGVAKTFYGTRVGPGWYQGTARVARGCQVPFSVLRMLMQTNRKPPRSEGRRRNAECRIAGQSRAEPRRCRPQARCKPVACVLIRCCRRIAPMMVHRASIGSSQDFHRNSIGFGGFFDRFGGPGGAACGWRSGATMELRRDGCATYVLDPYSGSPHDSVPQQ
jgi:hypothetical protein